MTGGKHHQAFLIVLLAAVLLAPASLYAQTTSQSPYAGFTAGVACTPNGALSYNGNSFVVCTSGVWVVEPVQTGAATASCAAGTAGQIQWNGSALQYCTGTSWATIASGVTGSGTTNYVARWISSTALGTGTLYDNSTNVGIGTTTPNGSLNVYAAPIGTANYGLLSLGNGPWNGTSTGFFAGSASGTVIAANTASGYAGNLMDLQVAGASELSVTKGGNIYTVSGAYIGASASGIEIINNGGVEFFGNGNANGGFIYEGGSAGMGLYNGNGGFVGWSSQVNIASNDGGLDTALTRAAAATIHLGLADAAAPVAQTLGVQNVLGGTTNTAGANFTITGSRGTGNQPGGAIVFQTAPAASSGGTQNALAEAMRISGAGNVGIGTAAPPDALDIGTNSQNRIAFQLANNNNGSSIYLYQTYGNYLELGGSNGAGQPVITSSANLNFSAAGATTMTVTGTSTGSGSINFMPYTGYGVGVGTTGPNAPLDVNGNALFGAGGTGNRVTIGYGTPPGGGGGIGLWALGSGQSELNGYGTLTISAQGSNVLINPSSGNVGIGTTTPTTALQIDNYAGGLQFNPNPTYQNAIVFNGAYSSTLKIDNQDAGQPTIISNVLLHIWSSANIDFSTNGGSTSQMTIAGSGNVGIGTTGPAYLLHVGSASASGTVAEFQNSSGNCTFTPTTSAWSCSSDARLKKDIVDTGDALPWLEGMRIRDFTLRATGEHKTGVIAQEMLPTHPDMVRVGKDGFYTVDDPNPWKLVKAIQELKSDNDGLRKEIAREEDEIANLRREVRAQ